MNSLDKAFIKLLTLPVVVIILFGLGAKHAFAYSPIGATAPLASSSTMTRGGTNPNKSAQPYFGVGTGAFDGKDSYAKVYVPQQYQTNVTLNINEKCSIDVGAPSVTFTAYKVKIDGSLGPQSGAVASRLNESYCGTSQLLLHLDNAPLSNNPTYQGYRIYYIEAHINNTSGSNEKYYRLQVNLPGNATGGLVGMAQGLVSNPADPWFGIYQGDAHLQGYSNWNWSLEFAPSCSAIERNRTLQIYDIDAGVYSQPNLAADLQEETGLAPDSPQSGNWSNAMQEVSASPFVPNHRHIPWGTNPAIYGYTHPNWLQGNHVGSGTTNGANDLGFYAQKYYRYSLSFTDLNWQNTVQITIPFDQFDATSIASQNCWPSCQVTSPPKFFGIPQNQNTDVTVQGYPQNSPYINWVAHGAGSGYFIKQIGASDGEQQYRFLSGNNPYTDTVKPPPGFTGNVTYTFSIVNSLGNQVGDTCQRTFNVVVPAPITVNCQASQGVDVDPGQNSSNLYSVVVTAYGNSGVGGNSSYSVKLTPSGGANVTAPNPQSLSIPNSPGGSALSPGFKTNPPLTFGGSIDYGGGFTVTISGGLLATPTSCGNAASTATRPYFVVQNGDISTGGGFESANNSCNGSTDPPYVTPATSPYSPAGKTPSTAQDFGGLRAFSSPYSKGSSASYGVDALGEIYKNTNSFWGFYSTSPSTNGYYPLFANVISNSNPDLTSTSYGGYLNTTAKSHCVLDFYHTTPTTSVSQLPTFNGGSVSGLSGQYQASDGLTITGGTINAGTQATIYVSGDVEISGDIKNQPNWDASNPKNVPFLTIVALGNITIDAGVIQLDGLFIAQPAVTDANNFTGGQFYTCPYQTAGDFCPKQLVVNGAVIAQEVHLLRAHGTLNGPSVPNNLTAEPAEIFNYSPAMVIGVPAFKQQQSLQGLFSLPPVF